MDSGFTNQRDSDAMTRDNQYDRENYYRDRLIQTQNKIYDLEISLKKANGYLKDVLDGVYCKEDMEEYLNGQNND